jgi:hypothetical protein
VLCDLELKTLQGADIAFDTEGQISVVAAAMLGSAETWKAMTTVGNLPSSQPQQSSHLRKRKVDRLCSTSTSNAKDIERMQ